MVSLASKYRPQTFEEVCGQKSTVKILSKQAETGLFKHNYLFCGNTGSGKSTMARLVAKAINKGQGSPIEIDAASNNSVENVRAIIKDAQDRSIDSEYKVYILDEVQAFSSAAWQPLLKTMEEPPQYTVFILCTTDPQKVPEAVMNRAQRFNFGKISLEEIKNRLEYVCQCEGFSNYQESVEYIAKIADGCMREALTLLEKVASYNTIFDICVTMELLGAYRTQVFVDFTNNLLDDNEGAVLQQIDQIDLSGRDLPQFVDQYLRFIIDVAKYAILANIKATTLPISDEELIKGIINFENPVQYYNYVMDKLLALKNMLKGDADPKSTVEVVCLQICRMR